jgi:DNA mismatch repair ATPase MutS
MRVQDSLERGVSYFMAELQRLKQIVDAAGARDATRDALVLYLLDEILHGTNSAERQIAARRIVGFLVDAGAIGAVTTHDLTLADEVALREVANAIHFTEQVLTDGSGPGMTFDYKIRPGIATSTNALKLMELVGFELAPRPSEAAAGVGGHPVSSGSRGRG